MIDYSFDLSEEEIMEIADEAEKWFEFTKNSDIHAMARIHVKQLLQALWSEHRNAMSSHP